MTREAPWQKPPLQAIRHTTPMGEGLSKKKVFASITCAKGIGGFWRNGLKQPNSSGCIFFICFKSKCNKHYFMISVYFEKLL